MTSLRAQKKFATARNLANSAYTLAVEKDLESVTTEEIAAGAGVSRRTFANYYPNKYAAVIDGFINTLEIPISMPDNSLGAESVPDSLADLITIIESFARDVILDPTRVRHIQNFARLMMTHPRLEPHLHARFQDFEHSDLLSALNQRFGKTTISILLGATYGSLVGVLRLLLGPIGWPAAQASAPSPPELSDAAFDEALTHITTAFTHLRYGFISTEKELTRA